MAPFIKTFSLVLSFAFAFSVPGFAADLELSGWLVYWDHGASLKTFEQNIGQLRRVCPAWYQCNAQGQPEYQPDASPGLRKKTHDLAQQHGVQIFALVNNYSQGDFDPVRVSKFLHNPARMHAHVQALIKLAKNDGAQGLDVDYECLKAQDRQAYSEFMESLAKACHQAGLRLAVAVHPKIQEPGSWDGDQAQDWKRLGACVDLFRPMCYDYHWPTSEAGPLAPLGWVSKVLELALKEVPREKIELGIPAYGYDWVGKKTSASYDWQGFQTLQKTQGKAERDPNTQELTLKYGGRHEVWFSDAAAIKPKLGLAKKLALRGVALWRLGSEDPAFWQLFQN